jgi:hypothetical protein
MSSLIQQYRSKTVVIVVTLQNGLCQVDCLFLTDPWPDLPGILLAAIACGCRYNKLFGINYFHLSAL